MKLSIVTPVYNDPRVGRALTSILLQERRFDLETIVIDGGSSGETLRILEEMRGRISTLVSERDRGIYDAMNKGVARATGDVVGILNADDYYFDASVLQGVADAFADPSVHVCYGDLVYVDQEGRVVRYWKSGAYRPSNFYFGWMPPHPTFFVRREVYERYGAFDLAYRISADYELMLRLLLRHRLQVGYLDRIMVRMTTGGNSNRSIGNILRANMEVYQAWRANHLHLGLLVPLIKPARKPLQFLRKPAIDGHGWIARIQAETNTRKES